MPQTSQTYLANETVYCRFTREAFTVVSCNGCVATLSDGSTRPVGELTRLIVPGPVQGAHVVGSLR